MMLPDIAVGQPEHAWLCMVEAAMQQAGEAMVVLDASTTNAPANAIRYVNDAFTRLTGFTAEESVGQTLQLLEAGRPNVAAHKQMRQAFEAATPVHVELLNYHKDGSAFWVEWSLAPVFDEQEQLACWVCIQRDVTRRRQREARGWMGAALLREVQDAIYVRDLAGHITYWNQSAERLFGWSATEVIERRVDQLLFAPGSFEVIAALQHTREHGTWTGELHPLNRAGHTLTVDSRWILMQEEPASILVVNTDITEKKKQEEQLLRAQRLESIGTLTSGIAHDLNNVLNSIVMAGSLLGRQPLEESSRQLVGTIENNAQRGVDILKQVLAFARGASGARDVVQPLDAIRNIEQLIRETFPRSIEIHVEAAPPLWTIRGNATQLEQVLMNLSVNARDAMPEGGALSIAAGNVQFDEKEAQRHPEARPGPYVAIQVSDTGEGIRPNLLDKIFDPFFSTKKLAQGTGLGLSTTRGIIQGLGGFIHVQSQVRRGTTFSFFIPAAQVQMVEPPPPARDDPAGSLEGRGEVILLVDDEHDILTLGKTMLEKFGYRVLTAQDGQDAVRLFEAHRQEIQVVVTDIMMPRMDGFETIRTLVELDPHLKFLATSGFVSKERLIQLTRAGAHAFLPKPFTIERLLTVLQSLLRSTDPPASASE